MLVAVAGMIHSALNIVKVTDGNIEVLFEKSYIGSTAFALETDHTIYRLVELIDEYKSEEHILAGKTIDKEDLEHRTEQTYWEREDEIPSTPEMTKELREEVKKRMIAEDLDTYKQLVHALNKIDEPLYYVTDGEHTFTNTSATKKEQFEKLPVYYISEDYDDKMYPNELRQNYTLYGTSQGVSHFYRSSDAENTKIFVGYTEDYIENVSKEWNEQKKSAMNELYYLFAFMTLFIIGLVYLIVTTGRNSFKDKTVHLNLLDKLYVDLTIVLLCIVMVTWFVSLQEFIIFDWVIYPVTLSLLAIFVVLLLSLIRHTKNRTIVKHSIIYLVFSTLYRLLNDIYRSGTVGVKVVVIVILYPIVTAATVFFFPIVIGLAVWIAMRKVKDFNKIQEGTKLMRGGNLHHRINIEGEGEFAVLAANINGINEGFKRAVHNELKNERMKTELITNVSHDIRTPLTSLITYTDLLKQETDPEKTAEYITILEQKSQRLKVLTDDLFAAAKASSGDIPVDLQQIDIVALLNQGIGEVSEQIAEKNLAFKFNYPNEKVYVLADGKLLWRAIENILSNIFNYALEGSRVYIDILEHGEDILISFKNISKYELNISEEELLERFKRGDESRTSHGSGLGLSITESLIENQHGKFEINIDGDLFKSMIYLPKADDMIC